MNLFNLLNIKNSSNLAIVKAEIVKEKLNSFLSPQMKEMGLFNWDKNYHWSSDFNEYGTKHVLEYVCTKGVSGTFQYGNFFNFIPTINEKGKVLKNHTQLQLFERAKGWHDSFETEESVKEYRVSHWNEYFFDKTLPIIFNGEKVRIAEWFTSNENIEQNIETTLRQINDGGAYSINSPNQKYILAFLYAKNGDVSLAKSILHDFYKPLLNTNNEFKAEFNEIEKLIIELS